MIAHRASSQSLSCERDGSQGALWMILHQGRTGCGPTGDRSSLYARDSVDNGQPSDPFARYRGTRAADTFRDSRAQTASSKARGCLAANQSSIHCPGHALRQCPATGSMPKYIHGCKGRTYRFWPKKAPIRPRVYARPKAGQVRRYSSLTGWERGSAHSR